MSRGTVATPPGTIPGRGDLLPTLAGRSPDGLRRSTRDYYLRRNLAVVVGTGPCADDWFRRSANVRERARAEDGEIILIATSSPPTDVLPTIADDGTLAARIGVADRDTPAIFVIDRYGTVFATNAGDTATPDLEPEDIPRWLEFIACRCS